jgi:hypothetical protein
MSDEGEFADGEFKKLDDDQVVALLTQRILELEGDLQRTKIRAADNSVWFAASAFVASIVALLFASYLAILPYLGNAPFSVPAIISNISAFSVLFFLYLAHRSFGIMTNKREYDRSARHAISDARFALTRATDALAEAEEESPNAH